MALCERNPSVSRRFYPLVLNSTKMISSGLSLQGLHTIFLDYLNGYFHDGHANVLTVINSSLWLKGNATQWSTHHYDVGPSAQWSTHHYDVGPSAQWSTHHYDVGPSAQWSTHHYDVGPSAQWSTHHYDVGPCPHSDQLLTMMWGHVSTVINSLLWCRTMSAQW